MRKQAIRIIQVVSGDLRSVTALFCMLLVMLALPWTEMLPKTSGYFSTGLPLSYFVSLIMIPAATILGLFLHSRMADDTDRHDPEHENE